MIIDCHNHPNWYGHTYDKFIENMDKYNIDKTCLLTWEVPADEWNPEFIFKMPPVGPDGPLGLEHVLEFCQKNPERFIPGYAPDPRKPDALDKLAAAIEEWGIKVYGELKLRMMYDNPDALRVYRYCGEKNIPVLVHIDYEIESKNKHPRPNWWYGGGIEAFERAIAACPGTNFIGHAPGFWAHISGDNRFDVESYPTGKVVEGGKLIQMLEKYPNLYCDISAGSGCNALKRDPEFAEKFLTKYQDRVMYGRDYFDNVHQEFLETISLTNEVKEKLFCKNVTKLLSLE